jgi:hypothetical protein
VLLRISADGCDFTHRRAGIAQPFENEFKRAHPHRRIGPPNARIRVRDETFWRRKLRKIAPVIYGGGAYYFTGIYITDDSFRSLRG